MNKRHLFVLISILVIVFSVKTMADNFTSGTQTAVKFGVHEITLTGDGSVSNPFDTICTVTFTPPSGPANAKTVHAFYDGGDTWRARCYITEIGTWTWISNSADDALLNNNSGSFAAEGSSLRGMLKPHDQNPQMWMTDNNKTFANIADTAYRLFATDSWADDYQAYVAEDVNMGISTMRCMILGWGWWDRYFEGGADGDKEKPHLSNFQHTDGRIRWLLDNYPDIYTQLILFSGGLLSGDSTYWRDSLTDSQRNRMMRYIIARFAAFPNKFWEVTNDTICHDQATHPATWFWATNVGNYFKDNDPWGHFMAFGHRRDDPYPFCDHEWSTYIVGYTQYDIACELIEFRGYDIYPKHVYNTEDYYETYNPPLNPKYFYRRLMWSYLLTGASATYAQIWNDIVPYSQSGCEGIDSIPYIRYFLVDRDIDLALFTPDDGLAVQINAPGPEYNDGPSKPQCTRRGYEEFIIYIPNAAEGEKAGFGDAWAVVGEYTRRDAALDSGKTPQVKIDLRSVTGVYVVQWYRVVDGASADGSAVAGGDWQTLTSPWQGEDVVLYLSRISGPDYKVIAAEADTYVRSGSYADDNFGSDTILYVKEDSGNPDYTRETYLRFDLSSIPGNIVSAKVKLYMYDVEYSTTHYAHLAGDNSWQEHSITWNTRPAADYQIDNWVPSDNTWSEIDVTAEAQNALSGDRKLSISVTGESLSWDRYYSREYGAGAYAPQIMVIYNLGDPADFNNDGNVNLKDFAILASYWLKDNMCSATDWCQGSDSDKSETVDLSDFIFFVERWLSVNDGQ